MNVERPSASANDQARTAPAISPQGEGGIEVATSHTARRMTSAKEVALVRYTRFVGNKAEVSVVAGRPCADQCMDARRMRTVVDEIIDARDGKGPF